MSIEARDIRCVACGSLLARLDGGVLVIQRGDLLAKVAGELHAELTCYRRTCRRLTAVHLAAPISRHTTNPVTGFR